MKAEQKNKLTARLRLALRWVVLGWWAVPLLVITALLVSLLGAGGYWTGDENDCFHHHDPELDAVLDWCSERLQTFFP